MKYFLDFGLPIILTIIAAAVTASIYPLAGLYPLFFLAVILSSYLGKSWSGFISSVVAMILISLFIETNNTKFNSLISGISFLTVAGVAAVLTRKKNKLEADLDFAESRSRQLADNHADAIITIDSVSNIDYANDAAGRMFGYTKEELENMNMLELMPQRYRAGHRKGMESYMQTGKRKLDWTSVIVEGLRKDGSEIKVEISFGEMLEGGRRLFSAFIRDITEREAQKLDLESSKERYQAFIENSDQGIWRIEYDNPIPVNLPVSEQLPLLINTSYFAECNDATAKLYGLEASSDLVGKYYKDVIPLTQESEQSVLDFIEKDYRIFNLESSRINSNGRESFFNSNIIGVVKDGALTRVWGVHRDITEDIMAANALRDSEQRFRLVTESVKDHAIISIDKDGVVLTWNKGAELIYGYTAEEAMGRKLTFIFPADVDAEAKLKEELSIAINKGKFEGEEVRVNKEGKELVISITITPLLDEKGTLKFYGKIDRDITERINFVKQLESKNEELVAVNKSKDQFLATLSHELRTPLVSILGYANMLATSKLSKDAQVRAIETIARNTRLQVDLIEDLLDVSRIIAGKITLNTANMPLYPLISEIVETFRPQAIEKGLEVNFNMPHKDVIIEADKRRISQIIINLMSNAIKFTPPKGKIDIGLSKISKDGFVVISFKDTGIGISPEMFGHLFERFKQADSTTTRNFSGLGLGLSIARQLVELHGGSIWAESKGEGKGSTFYVKLCCAFRDPTSDFKTFVPEELLSPEFTLVGTKLLVVDDDEDTRFMLNDFFTRYGADVLMASSAKEAREIVNTAKPDVFIFDIGMPDEDGYTLIRSFRSEGFLTPALALTAFVGKEYEEAATKAGFDAYIPKPASLDYLARKVQELKDKNNR